MLVDLTPYMNTSTFVVPDSFSLERAYLLFRTMGLRHLVVVDEHNHVKVGSRAQCAGTVAYV
jgi:chloride channel 7